MTGGRGKLSDSSTSAPQRLEAVDALRALALLGILSVNVWFFAHPESLETGMRSAEVTTSGDQLVRFGSTLFFEGKSYVVFSFLFGLSFVLAWASAHRAGVSEATRTVRRCVALIVLGVLHGVFLFVGDILLAYGILGFALLGMRRVRTKWALILAGGLLVVWGGAVLGIGLLTASLEGTAMWDESLMPAEDPAAAAEAYASSVGSYLGFQVSIYPMLAFSILIGQGPMAFAAFLIGLVVGRAQVVERIVSGDISTARLLLITIPALSLGISVSAVAAVVLWGTPGSLTGGAATAEGMMGAEMTASGLIFLAGPVQALGYVLLALLIFRSKAAHGLIRVLSPTGRMSLTNYLSQSLVLALVFSGLGAGLAGQLSAVQVAGLVAGLWLSQVLLSWIWFRRFRRGPLEAPVRTWTYAVGRTRNAYSGTGGSGSSPAESP